MEKFYPSEIARLVLGYLKEVRCPDSWRKFVVECTHLQEYYQLYKDGEEHTTKVNRKNLKEILDEYCILKQRESMTTKKKNKRKQENIPKSVENLNTGNQRSLTCSQWENNHNIDLAVPDLSSSLLEIEGKVPIPPIKRTKKAFINRTSLNNAKIVYLINGESSSDVQFSSTMKDAVLNAVTHILEANDENGAKIPLSENREQANNNWNSFYISQNEVEQIDLTKNPLAEDQSIVTYDNTEETIVQSNLNENSAVNTDDSENSPLSSLKVIKSLDTVTNNQDDPEIIFVKEYSIFPKRRNKSPLYLAKDFSVNKTFCDMPLDEDSVEISDKKKIYEENQPSEISKINFENNSSIVTSSNESNVISNIPQTITSNEDSIITLNSDSIGTLNNESPQKMAKEKRKLNQSCSSELKCSVSNISEMMMNKENEELVNNELSLDSHYPFKKKKKIDETTPSNVFNSTLLTTTTGEKEISPVKEEKDIKDLLVKINMFGVENLMNILTRKTE